MKPFVPVIQDTIQELKGDLQVPEIRVWCHPSEGGDYYEVFQTFQKALEFTNTHIESEAVPLIAFMGYEIDIFAIGEVSKMKNEIIIDGVKYIPASKKESIGDIKIVILQRGWVMVGRFEKEGTECKLHNASVIRVWGTTKGLGQLANEGKQKETILDKCYGLVQFDWLTVVAIIDCKEDIWANEL